jgi:WD40 repeat protein
MNPGYKVTGWLVGGLLLVGGLTGCLPDASNGNLDQATPGKTPVTVPTQAEATPTADIFTTSAYPLAPTHLPPTPTPLPVSVTPLPGQDGSAFVKEIAFNSWELVLELAWSPDGRLLAISAGEQIHLIDPSTVTILRTLEGGVWSPGLAFNRQSTRLASASRDGHVSVWDPASGQRLIEIPAHNKSANSVAFHPSLDWLATSGNDGMARLWDFNRGEKVGEMIGGSFGVPAIAFSPDGKSLALVNGDIVRLRDITSGRFVQTLRSETPLYSAAFNPDGSLLAAGSSTGTITLWDVASGQQAGVYLIPGGNAGLVWEVGFSPDGEHVAAVSADGRLSIWETAGGALIKSIQAHTLAASSLAYSPDGEQIATGGLDAIVRIWSSGP